MRQSFDQIILTDTAENLAKLKQFRLITDWYKKLREGQFSGQGGAAQGSSSFKGTIDTIKKLISDKLAKSTSPQLSGNMKDRILSEAKSRLGKGLDIPPISLPPIKPSITFTPNIDGVPIKNNMLKLSFELDSIVHLKGITGQLEAAERLFSVGSLAVELKLYALTPMVIGAKKTKIGEQTFNILENLKFGL
jgi:hypothetical protein